MSRIISSRMPLFKFMGTVGLLHLGTTYFLGKADPVKTMSVSQYLKSNNITQTTSLNIVGTIKPRSVKIHPTTLGKRFELTDMKNQIQCVYQGRTQQQFKQGETTLVKGYCPDLRKQNYVIVKQIMTKHSMETKEWQSKVNVSRNSSGVQTYF